MEPKSKEAGSNANDRDRLAVERDGLAGDGGVRAELALPERIAQQDGGPTPFLAFLLGKEPSKDRLDAQRGKEISGHLNAEDRLWLGVSGELVLDGVVERLNAGYVLEGPVVALKFLVRIDRVGGAGQAAFPFVRRKPRKPLRIPERQRAQ